MSENKLHIVSFDVPYPPDYGGAIDVFFKIKALKEAGCSIYLHCYEYGRARSAELEKLCEQVWYYPRKPSAAVFSFLQPYIVASRASNDMLFNLQRIDAPILFEGVHTTWFSGHRSFESRFTALRTHNAEHEYFRQLALAETSLAKKLLYKIEALRLKKYEQRLNDIASFFEISTADQQFFLDKYPNAQHTFIPPFHAHNEVISKAGTGSYALYHGNLSHPENRAAALFLLKEVIPFVHLPFIIAGRQPTKEIIDACAAEKNCTLMPNPDAAIMDELTADAQVHVLPTFQQSGMKLKLLAALFAGRHVVVNTAMLHGTGMDAGICAIANNAAEFIKQINTHIHKDFTEEDIAGRTRLLSPYSNAMNARKLMEAIRF